jgi:hypothetical protein
MIMAIVSARRLAFGRQRAEEFHARLLAQHFGVPDGLARTASSQSKRDISATVRQLCRSTNERCG